MVEVLGRRRIKSELGWNGRPVIIGVDETGDFRLGSRAVVVASLIQPSKYEAVCASLREWEKATRKRLGISNEIKGSHLDPQAAESFLADVVRTGTEPTAVGYMAFAVDVTGQSLEAMEVQRRLFVDGYESWSATVRERGGAESRKFANQLTSIGGWVGARTPRHLLRIVTLAAILPRLVEHAFAFSIIRGFDEELVELRITTDHGYVKGSESDQWTDVVRNVFIGATQENAIPFSDQWGPDHPVVAAFVEDGAGDFIRLSPSFKDRFSFGDSVNTPEVRLADVMASIIGRSEFEPAFVGAHERLRPARLHEERYTVLQWTTEARSVSRDPYALFERGLGRDEDETRT